MKHLKSKIILKLVCNNRIIGVLWILEISKWSKLVICIITKIHRFIDLSIIVILREAFRYNPNIMSFVLNGDWRFFSDLGTRLCRGKVIYPIDAFFYMSLLYYHRHHHQCHRKKLFTRTYFWCINPTHIEKD